MHYCAADTVTVLLSDLLLLLSWLSLSLVRQQVSFFAELDWNVFHPFLLSLLTGQPFSYQCLPVCKSGPPIAEIDTTLIQSYAAVSQW